MEKSEDTVTLILKKDYLFASCRAEIIEEFLRGIMNGDHNKCTEAFYRLADDHEILLIKIKKKFGDAAMVKKFGKVPDDNDPVWDGISDEKFEYWNDGYEKIKKAFLNRLIEAMREDCEDGEV